VPPVGGVVVGVVVVGVVVVGVVVVGAVVVGVVPVVLCDPPPTEPFAASCCWTAWSSSGEVV
jgi:hypothetical protein